MSIEDTDKEATQKLLDKLPMLIDRIKRERAIKQTRFYKDAKAYLYIKKK